MKLSVVLLVVSCALIVTVSGADMEEGAAAAATGVEGGFSFVKWCESFISTALTLLSKYKVAVFCTAIMAVISAIYFRRSSLAAQRDLEKQEFSVLHSQLQEAAEDEDSDDQEKAANAARSYAKSAKYFKEQADDLKEKGRMSEAIAAYEKSATMYVSASERASYVDAVDDYDENDTYNGQREARQLAAVCYEYLAKKSIAADDADEAYAMNLGAAGRYEENAKCAAAHGSLEAAALDYTHAADRYADVDFKAKEKEMREAAAEQYEAHGAQTAKNGYGVDATFFFHYASRAYKAIGDHVRARSTSEEMVKLYEAGAMELAADDQPSRIAAHYANAAESYEAVGNSNRAKSMRRKAAEKYEEIAIKQEEQGQIEGAIEAYRQASSLYDNLRDHQKAIAMGEAASRLLVLQ